MVIKGQKINDRYQIIRTIGEGGMANVYLAYDTILNREVAVKLLRGDLADDEKFVRRFQREAISASSLSHPNIVEMYDVGEDDGKYYIVMEYVDGKTLKSLIKRRGGLTLTEVIDIMLQLTSAVACAHDSYIIHRDIKPQNVLIKEDGTVKITDFGIAMALNSNELTQTNSVMGSVHYLPPEQANGSGSTIKSDIYSLGILMFELLTGKLPFKGDNAVEIAIKQMRDQIPSVCAINSEIPQSIENIILKSCAKNPKNRYENVLEMHNDIKNALNEERKDEQRITYRYSEHDLEETKIMPNLNKTSEQEVKKEEKEESTKSDKTMNGVIIGLVIAAISLIAIISAVILVPALTQEKEIVVPDVSNMSVVDAEKTLKKLGFTVNTETKLEPSDTVKEGLVIGTKPVNGVSRKEGTEITLVISSGEEGIVVENYIGKNYYEVKGMLEANGIVVMVDKKEVQDKEITENTIIEQYPEVGTKVIQGGTVKLVIPDVITKYPNFVSEGWTVEDISKFCEEYGLTLTIVEEETDLYPAGRVIKQSRSADSRVIAGVSLKITVAKEVTFVEPENPEDIPGEF
ncbi:MAG: Stk1 family PASTA domain-containing Ser/Thr kinase [Firmicutes bacterium]|nr:Stk1 family PASTA domain-containing Ser/Thr kinase [Bacillota bacterium]